MRDFKIMPVIMSGGAGSRLWPASRAAAPKQLLKLVTDKTMVQDTALRVSGPLFTPPVFICNAAHSDAINTQMEDIGTPALAVITEPMGRNTAPAAVVAAQYAKDYSRKNGVNTLVLLQTRPKRVMAILSAAKQLMPAVTQSLPFGKNRTRKQPSAIWRRGISPGMQGYSFSPQKPFYQKLRVLSLI